MSNNGEGKVPFNHVLEIQNVKHTATVTDILMMGRKPGEVSREQTLKVLEVLQKCLTPEALGNLLDEVVRLRADNTLLKAKVEELEKER